MIENPPPVQTGLPEPAIGTAYRESSRSAVPIAAYDQAMRVVVEERIRELWAYREWWRTNRWADWPTIRMDLVTELRALVRLARRARGISRDAAREAAAGDHFVYPAGVGR